MRSATLALSLVFAAAFPVHSQDAAKIDLHGFGGWSFGRTSATNVYLGGLPEGDFRHSQFALNLGVQVNDLLRVHAQAEWQQNDDGNVNVLDFAFAEVKVNDKLSLRAGQVKQPFGIYTELYTVGTVRPFLSLPQSVYGSVGFVGQSYKGVGLTGSQTLGSNWTSDYDLYVGGSDLEKSHSVESFYRGESLDNIGNEVELQSTRNVVGGRLVLHTPIDGLSVGGSAYTGTLNEPAANRRNVGGAQLEYLSDKWWVRSELANEHQVGDEDALGYYGEVAYFFTPRWQGAMQYDVLENTFNGIAATNVPSLQEHDEVALGLNYWWSRELVLKLDLHSIDGNRFSLPHPELLTSTIAAGQLKTHTTLLRFGAQFSF
ncbi:MAG: hypothetical protein ABJE10_01650 [bacterium]